jgi:hypothetical protein
MIYLVINILDSEGLTHRFAGPYESTTKAINQCIKAVSVSIPDNAIRSINIQKMRGE